VSRGEIRWKSPPHLDRYFGKKFHNGEISIDDCDETGAEQLGEMSG
jgi:hypothetical protein